jgi:hypothetical protein
MGMMRRILGPKSKSVKELPHTYEARVRVCGDTDITNTFMADTICGLVGHLQGDGIEPSGVEIREVYQKGDQLSDKALYIAEDGGWLARPAPCRSFAEYYPGHIDDGDCTFSDRDHRIAGM